VVEDVVQREVVEDVVNLVLVENVVHLEVVEDVVELEVVEDLVRLEVVEDVVRLEGAREDMFQRHFIDGSVTGNRVCTYCIYHVLVRGYDDVGRVPHRGNAAAYVRIDNHGHQYRYRVQLHHFT
jgi:hypothetical protein